MNRVKTVIVFSILTMLFSSSVITISAEEITSVDPPLIDGQRFLIDEGISIVERVANIVLHPFCIPYMKLTHWNDLDRPVEFEWRFLSERTDTGEVLSDTYWPGSAGPDYTVFNLIGDYFITGEDEFQWIPIKFTATLTMEDGSSLTKVFHGRLFGIFGPIWWNWFGIIVDESGGM